MARRTVTADADVLALEALAFLANSPDDLVCFMRVSGVDPAGLRARAAEPQFLGGVLDYLLSSEKLLMRFCEQQCVEPAMIHRSRAQLSHSPLGAR